MATVSEARKIADMIALRKAWSDLPETAPGRNTRLHHLEIDLARMVFYPTIPKPRNEPFDREFGRNL